MTTEINAASVALINRDKVLLIQRARPPYYGMWSLPGGRIEAGETAEACAAREVKEELGLTVFSLRAVRRMTLGNASQFVLQVFATQSFEGEIARSDEITGHQWIRPEMLATLIVTPELGDVLGQAFAIFDRR